MFNFERPKPKKEGPVEMDRRRFLINVLGAVAASAVPGSEALASEYGNEDIRPFEVVFPKKLVDDVVSKYGKDAYEYAKKVIINGQRIANSPHKKEEIEKLRLLVASKYHGGTKIPKYFGYINEPKELKQIAASFHYRSDVMHRAKTVLDKAGIHGVNLTMPVSFIISALGNEGKLFDVDTLDEELQNWNSEVDGFDHAGLDLFSYDYRNTHTQVANLLPEEFATEFSEAIHENEKGVEVRSAVFKSKGSVINAFIAELVARQILCLQQLKKHKIDLTSIPKKDMEDILLFLTYIYYNGGPNKGDRIVSHFKSAQDALRLFEHYKGINADPSKSEKVNLDSAPANACVILAGMEWLRLAGATDAKPEKETYWWLKEPAPKVSVVAK